MKVSLNWLTDYVDVSSSAAELGELFTSIGLNCDAIDSTDTDVVFTLDVTSNRPDWLGHLGVARELAAATGAVFRTPGEQARKAVLEAQAGKEPASKLTGVRVEAPDLCPRYTARIIRGVRVGQSPEWMVQRLEALGLRSVNNVVDVTNYVMMEYSQPLHSFDLAKLDQRRIVVRRAQAGERMVSIDGTTCELTPEMLVIADARRPVAVAGIMGGLDTEVSAQTTDLLIEAAQFDPLNTRRTSRALGLLSESNYRFERGVDPVLLDEASMRACQLILQLAGGELALGVVDVWAKPFVAPVVRLRPSRATALLGYEIPASRQVDLLARLGLEPRVEGGDIICTIPSHRSDLTREADLVEEVARLYGYAAMPLSSRVTHAVEPEGLAPRVRRRAGEVLSAAGFDEAITPTFVDAQEEALLGQADPVRVMERVRKSNNAVRTTLIGSLLRLVKVNQDAGNDEVSLFEVAAVFPPGKGALPEEYVQIGLVSTGDLRDLRGAVEALVEDVGRTTLELAPGEQAGMATGASAELLVAGKPAGVIGMVAPAALGHYGLERPVCAATLRLDALMAGASKVRRYSPLPRFPAVRRDLSLILDESVTWRELSSAIAGIPQPARRNVEYVTTYRGKPVAQGKKSVTLTLTYRADDGTLRREQVDALVESLLAGLAQAFPVEVRTQ